MISYATVGSTNFEASLKFFDATLGALGCVRTHEYMESGWVGYGAKGSEESSTAQVLWLNRAPFNGQPATAGNGSMVGFVAATRAQVDQFHAAAIGSGGSSEGAPGVREAYGPDFYIAYVRDPMGNKFSCVCRGQ